MHHPHTLRRAILAAAIALAALPLAAPPAAAAVVKPIVFPVDGQVTYTDTFGACRDGCTRRHEGQDLMGKKMMPLLAAVDGVVHRVSFNNTSSGGNSVTIRGADGWTYHYLHVNNDTPGTDDGRATRAQAFPSNIVLGASVVRGQVVGYLGDSGNAEGTSPHLHFEIRQPPPPGSYSGTPINPYESLRQALVWSRYQHWELRRTPSAGPPQDQFTFGGTDGDRALLCDWDADGVDEAVVFRSGVWHLRNGVTEGANVRQIAFGTAGDTPMCGDVDGDPGDEPVVFRSGRWTMRGGFGTSDPAIRTVRYGIESGDRPVMGDWDGNGQSDLAILRDGTWLVRSGSGTTGTIVTTFAFGRFATDLPVAGDWDADGDDDAGVFRAGTWYLRSTANAAGTNAPGFRFGNAGDQPVIGVWSDPVRPGLGVFRPRS
jgi:hypothetical protein